MHRNYDYVIKVVLIGSSAVGKTALLKRFADNEFSQYYISTIGVDFRFKSLSIDQQFVKLQIWDTAGQERFKNIAKSFYNNADAVIIVHDVNDQTNFIKDVDYWLKEVRTYCKSNVSVFVIGNKSDLGGYLKSQQRSYLDSQKLKYFITSAKTGKNVQETILDIARTMMKKVPKNKEKITNLELRETHFKGEGSEKKGCCG